LISWNEARGPGPRPTSTRRARLRRVLSQMAGGIRAEQRQPRSTLALLRMNMEIDARHVLPEVHVPTLVLHRAGDRAVKVEHGRYIAANIPGAKYVELAGTDHAPYAGDVDALLDEVGEFLTGVRHGPEPDRVLATVLFTDMVDATERAATLGDLRWRTLLTPHHALVRQQIERYRGREVDTAGDGFLATFDGPARAVRCACAVVDALRPIDKAPRVAHHRRASQRSFLP
jgi:hypothetical protein